jgi:hypothetical protein
MTDLHRATGRVSVGVVDEQPRHQLRQGKPRLSRQGRPRRRSDCGAERFACEQLQLARQWAPMVAYGLLLLPTAFEAQLSFPA